MEEEFEEDTTSKEIKRDYLCTVRQLFDKEYMDLEVLFEGLVLNDRPKGCIFKTQQLKMLNDMDQLKYYNNRMRVIEKMLTKYNKNIVDDQFCLDNIKDLKLTNLKLEFGYNIAILTPNRDDYVITIDEIASLTNCFTIYSNNVIIKMFIVLEHFIYYFDKSMPSLINHKEFISDHKRLTQFFELDNGFKEMEYLVKLTFCSLNGQLEEDEFLMNLLSCRPKYNSQFHLTTILKDNLQFGGCNNGAIKNDSLFSFYFSEIINFEKFYLPLIKKQNLQLPNDNDEIKIAIKNLNDVILLNIFKYLILIKGETNENDEDENIYKKKYYGFKNGIDIVNVSMVSNRFFKLMKTALSLIDWSQYDNIELLKSEVDYDCEKCLIKEPPSFTKYHILLRTTSGTLFKRVSQSIETLVIDTIGVCPRNFFLFIVDSCNIAPPFGSFENLKSLVIIGRVSVMGSQISCGVFGLPIQYIILNGNAKLVNFTLVDKVNAESSYDIDFIKQLLNCHKNTLKSFNLVCNSMKSKYHMDKIIKLIHAIPTIKLTLYKGNKIVEKLM
ncbi:hypothetical protein DDB_G0294555 [Dictyostelium discoideum AX4]|uniref:Uncharacterized protein n=1 Tax=Dictyostelium discoideum TaxID=44689 RepID=Q1ZXB6_DICDI|nr:hypothetical protein DDB_G0294555 [Dictyostelium discoideum AX4]EAS66818.1 hypothetical protein DDB_G0294555 [Dictyostelium discoideum AX4]|eukprot:XP_001134501.1 hypothetical protein DDB_G0294555 [Dictyostelium discoideum AX4]